MKPRGQNNSSETGGWTETISPVSGWTDIDLRGLWRYRDLVLLFVKRDFIAIYKQTILGPLWYLVQPIMTALVFTMIFSHIAGMSTD
jgi:lipopolysaccharide transport system permease protein